MIEAALHKARVVFKFKHTCRILPETFTNIHMAVVFGVVAETAPPGYHEITVTSGCDKAKGRIDETLHPRGLALDFRIKDLPGLSPEDRTVLEAWVHRIKTRLGATDPGSDYDVVLEVYEDPNSPTGLNGCIHIEFHRKVW
jgi:hypothetical protein